MELYDLFIMNYAPCVGLIFLSIILFFNNTLDKPIKSTFYTLILLEFAQTVFYSLELWTATFSEPVISRTLLSALGYSIRIYVAYSILILSLRNYQNKKQQYLLAIPMLINTILSFSAFFTDIVYSYTDENVFVRGPLGYAMHCILILYLLCILITTIIKLPQRAKLESIIVISILILLTFAILIEAIYNVREISQISIVLSIIFYYMFFQTQIFRENLNKEIKNIDILKQKNMLDEFTGLLNKITFEKMVAKSLSKKNNKNSALIIIDLDHFKEINDTLGHLTGDTAIKDIASKLQGIFRSKDLIGRFGGDEFVVYLKNISKELLYLRLEEILYLAETDYSNGENTVRLTTSIGAVFCKNECEVSWTELFEAADGAVYTAKDNGRNCYIINDLKK